MSSHERPEFNPAIKDYNNIFIRFPEDGGLADGLLADDETVVSALGCFLEIEAALGFEGIPPARLDGFVSNLTFLGTHYDATYRGEDGDDEDTMVEDTLFAMFRAATPTLNKVDVFGTSDMKGNLETSSWSRLAHIEGQMASATQDYQTFIRAFQKQDKPELKRPLVYLVKLAMGMGRLGFGDNFNRLIQRR